MRQDAYGLSTIQNLYYDTAEDRLIRNSIERLVYKEKLRVRGYGAVAVHQTVFVELKKKYKGVVYKRRLQTDLQHAGAFLDHGVLPDHSQIAREIAYMMDFYHLRKRLYLAYDRTAFYSTVYPQLRMTVDQNIRFRSCDLDFVHGDYGLPLLDQSRYLLEIKTVGAYPVELTAALSHLRIYPVSFSKYGNVYKKCNQHRREAFTCLPASLVAVNH